LNILENVVFRADTGPLQLGTDWPGIFIRGDDCARTAIMLVSHAEKTASGSEDKDTLRLCLMIAEHCELLAQCFTQPASKQHILDIVARVQARCALLSVNVLGI
jgi:hypothetical protein